MTSLIGKVFDSEGAQVAEVTVTSQQLRDGNWSWKPDQPGYYEIVFAYAADGAPAPIPLRGHYTRQVYDSQKKDIPPFEYDKERRQIVVAARAPSPDYGRGQFGFTCQKPSAIPLAKLIGFDFAFIQAFAWGGQFWDPATTIEPVKGQYDWSNPDWRVDALAKEGIPMAAQLLFTPTWASPHPEQQDVRLCTRRANCYAPADMADWDRFVRAAVGRYKDRIKIWEIWNEESMPDQSVFWYDTPENYAKLLQAGYRAVKETQPEAQVWIGGLGPRPGYYELYSRILALGAASWFDVLSLHGYWNTPETFRALDDKAGVPHKPVVESEWHAILHDMSGKEPPPTDRALGRRMMLDLLYQLKQGVERTITFIPSNQSGYEPEMDDFLRQHGIWGQSFGLFRALPWVEPRLPALVLQNFLALVGNRAVYVAEYDLGNGASGVVLDTAHGRQWVVWLDHDRPLRGLLPGGLPPSAEVGDWEGRQVPAKDNTTLAADRLYYLSGIPDSVSAGLAAKEVLFPPHAKKTAAGAVPQGIFTAAPLFADAKDGRVAPGAAWNERGWIYRALRSPQPPAGFSARFALGAVEQGVDVAVDVTDAIQFRGDAEKADGPVPALWNGDSIQFAFDCDGSGMPGGSAEFVAALTAQGPAIWKTAAAHVGGDLPAKWSSAGSRVENASLSISRQGNRTLYRLHLPWSELYPMVYEAGKSLRFSILVNDNDGQGRDGYQAWSGGIGDEKNPAAYGVLKPAGP